MSERIVHKIEKHQYANFGKKTVVIYARVSTNKPSQLHSMAMQVSALTQQVYRLWHWQLADIYIDFESGASDDRSEFQRMINDCISKRYNMVLTKSVSRFGRDTLDGLNAIRKLKQHGVDGIHLLIDPLNRTQTVLNLMDVCGWTENNIFVAFLQQAVFLFLILVFLHVLLSMQPHWYGWLTDAILISIICIFTPIAPLRGILAGFFKLVMLNPNALIHIGICLVLSALLAAAGLIVLKRKTL